MLRGRKGRGTPRSAGTQEGLLYSMATNPAQKDDGAPKRGPLSTQVVFRSLHASWFESGFLIHQSPQTYYRPDFLETTPMLIPPPPSWLSTQNPRTRPRHSAVDRLFASTGTTDFHVTFPLEPLTGHRDINKLSKFSCESMIFVPHDYCLVINLCIMLFPVK